MPFTKKEFDQFANILIGFPEYQIQKRESEYVEMFSSYLKITNFLLPKTDVLYAMDSIPYDFLDNITIPLDILPEHIIIKIIEVSNIMDKRHRLNPIIVKTIYDNPELLDSLLFREANDFVNSTKEIAESLGLPIGMRLRLTLHIMIDFFSS